METTSQRPRLPYAWCGGAANAFRAGSAGPGIAATENRAVPYSPLRHATQVHRYPAIRAEVIKRWRVLPWLVARPSVPRRWPTSEAASRQTGIVGVLQPGVRQGRPTMVAALPAPFAA